MGPHQLHRLHDTNGYVCSSVETSERVRSALSQFHIFQYCRNTIVIITIILRKLVKRTASTHDAQVVTKWGKLGIMAGAKYERYLNGTF